MAKTNVKRMIPVFVVAATVLSADADAKTVADEVKELKEIIASNSVKRVTGPGDCRYVYDWFYKLCTKEEREAILTRNVSAHRRWIELEPKNPVPQADLGCVYAAAECYAEAKPELEKALAMDGKLDAKRYVEVCWALANCLWLEGDKLGALKYIDEVAARYGNSHDEFLGLIGRAKYVSALCHDPDGDLDILKLPHSVDGRPFPTPQEATYGEKRLSLKSIDLKLEGLDIDNPVARLLRRKLERFGAKFKKGGTPVELVLAFDAPVDKPQGYSLDVKDGKVRIAARKRLGLTWGVVSFLQCVERRDRPCICEMAIRDWPKCERRGVLVYWRPDMLEYSLFNKMSSSAYCMDLEYVLSPVDHERYRLFARRMQDFGIQCYYVTRSIALNPTVAFSERRNRDNFVERAKFFASIGAGNAFMLDDWRFLPYHPVDKEKFGEAANFDAKLMTEIYREAKAEYPDHFMLLCPPFYFGPDGGLTPGWYPEPRDPYLKSLGNYLDPDIDVYWTGPRVKTHGITPEKAKWYTDLTGRKPIVNINGDGIPKNDCESFRYPSDPVGYKTDHCTNVFDLVAGFHQKVSHPYEACKVGGVSDWCWNPEAHDGSLSVKRAIDQLEGPGVYELVADAAKAMAPLSKYHDATPRVELFEDDPDVLDRSVAEAAEIWKKAKSIGKNGGLFVWLMEFEVGWKRRLASYRRNPPDWLKKEYEAVKANTAIAKEECGYDESKGDQFVPAAIMRGSSFFKGISDANKTSRDVKLMSSGDSVAGKFSCVLFPPEQTPTLIVSGKRYIDSWEKSANVPTPEMTIEVNGNVIWKDGLFKSDIYGTVEIKIPVVAVRRENTFSIKFSAPKAANQGRIAISYAVIRK